MRRFLVGKARRLLELIEKMNTGHKFTVGQLADEFKVSYRTMLRDLQEIEKMGIPLYSENGVHGGYRVLRRDNKTSLAEGPFCRIINVPTFHAVGFEYTMPLPSSGLALFMFSSWGSIASVSQYQGNIH
jgi:predicted transcriptional regulator